MSVRETEIIPSRALQRYYPWVVIGIAFVTVGVAFAHASVVTPAPQSPTRLKRTCAGPEA